MRPASSRQEQPSTTVYSTYSYLSSTKFHCYCYCYCYYCCCCCCFRCCCCCVFLKLVVQGWYVQQYSEFSVPTGDIVSRCCIQVVLILIYTLPGTIKYIGRCGANIRTCSCGTIKSERNKENSRVFFLLNRSFYLSTSSTREN